MAEINDRNGQTQKQTAEVMPGGAHQDSGTVGTSWAKVTFPNPTRSIIIQNTHASNDLYVLLKKKNGDYNTGTKYFTVGAGKTLSMDYRSNEIKVKGSLANTTWQSIATEE